MSYYMDMRDDNRAAGYADSFAYGAQSADIPATVNSAQYTPAGQVQYAESNQAHYAAANPRSMEELYPEIYKLLFPHASSVASEMGPKQSDGKQINAGQLDMMVEEILKRSGLLDGAEEDQATPVFAPNTYAQRGYGRRPYYRRPQYRRNDLGDLARILLLQQLFGRTGGYPYYPYPYYRPY